MIPVGNAGDYLRAVAGSRLVELPELGHVPQEESPAESISAIVEFLR